MGLPTPAGLLGSREARALNQAAPAVDLRRQEFLQLGRRRAVDRDGADPHDHVANLRRRGHRLELGMQPIDHRFGRRRRRADHRPPDGIEARHCGLRNRRDIGQCRDACGRTHAERTHPAGVDVADHAARVCKHERNVTGHHVVERGRRAAIGDAVHLGGGHALEQFGGEKDCRARAAVAKGDLAGLLRAQCDQFRNRFDRHAGVDQQRVTVRRRAGAGGGRNVAAGADAVLDDDRLAEPLLKFGSHCAHHDVDAAAGRESDDEGDRSGRELLSEAAAAERKEACQRGRNQNGTTCDHCSFRSHAGKSIRTIPARVRRCAEAVIRVVHLSRSASSRPTSQGRATYALASAPPVRLFWHRALAGGPVRPDEFFRGNAGRPRRCLVSPLLPLNSCRWFLRAMRHGGTGRGRLMRYIAIVALAFAFTGSAHGASNDPKATRKGGEEDTASKAAEGTAQQIAKPEIYWLDSAYRRSDGALIQEQREFLRNKGDARFLPPFSSLAECEAEAKYRMNWRGGRDSPVFERADCRPTAITRKMLNAVRKDYCWDHPKRPAWERPECRTAVEGLTNILERELKTK